MSTKLRLFSLTALAALITGCSVSLPFKWVDGLTHQQGFENGTSDDRVIVVITHATVDTNQRKKFDEAAYRVLDSLPSQSGLVGYSVRRQLWGNEVWTATVWTDDSSIQRFLSSPAHAQGVAESSSAVRHIQYIRLNIKRAELPIAWSRLVEVAREQEQKSSINKGP